MSWSFQVGRLFGSELRVHATFLLLLVWIGTAAWISDGPMAALVNIAFVLALFACVVAHEFGHALMARRYGIKTPDITLLPIGGVARLEKIPEEPAKEVAVAVAGPAVNVIIWAGLTILFGVEGRIESLIAIEDLGQGFLERIAAINLFLALFNMIPAFPMDGGRVLRAVLTVPLGRHSATRIAAIAGQFIAFLFGYVGLASGNPILLLIAVFVFMAAVAESSDIALHDLARGSFVRDAMITSFESLASDASFETAENALLRTTQSEFPVIQADGTLAGFLTKSAILEKSRQNERLSPVTGAIISDIPAVELTDPLEAAFDGLQKLDVPAVAVNDRHCNFIGYITRENLGEWAVLKHRKANP